MIIRSQQVQKLDDSTQAQYHEQLRLFYRQNYPDLVSRYDDATLLQKIAEADRRAETYKLETDEGYVAYIGLALAAGPQFHTDPKITAYMESPGKDPDAKVEWLFNRVSEQLRGLQASGALERRGGQ
jgi:hypothetical protein